MTLALTRTLVTQGIFLRLPPALTLGDGVVVPSLSAAVLLGLRETMGGDPDHLRIVTVTEPVGGDGRRHGTRLCSSTTPCPAAPDTSPSSPTRRSCTAS